jgi:hypothetical protein
MSEMFVLSDAKRKSNGKSDSKCINIRVIQESIGAYGCRHMPVLHAVGGCNTTSAIFGIAKGTVYKRLSRGESLETHLKLMQDVAADEDEVRSAGLALMNALNGGEPCESLGRLRYNTYCKLVTKNV